MGNTLITVNRLIKFLTRIYHAYIAFGRCCGLKEEADTQTPQKKKDGESQNVV